MITNLFDILFGCWHSNYSFPLTAKTGNRASAAHATGTYVVCLDCGKEFPYDWKRMRVVSVSPNWIEHPDSYTGTMLGELTEQVEGICNSK